MWHLNKIPKKAHFYWGNSVLPFDRFLSIASFSANNRDWAVFMHRPLGLSPELDTSWETHEHKKIKSSPSGNCFWDSLSKLENVEIVEHDLDSLGDISEVHKSDFLRWELLANDGGLWSDIDILYLRPMDDVYFNVAEPCVVDVDGFEVSLEPVIIAEVFCASSLEHGGPFGCRNEARDVAQSRDIVAEQHDDVRVQCVGAVDDLGDAIKRHPGIAGVDVGEGCDPERKVRRPLPRRQIVARQREPDDRLADAVGCGRSGGGGQSAEAAKKMTT